MGNNLGSSMDQVDKNVLLLVYLSIAALITGYAEVALLTYCGEANCYDLSEDKVAL